ncbi:hypothetical protein Droror1_Dr00002343 [Drosera rotundifolia]
MALKKVFGLIFIILLIFVHEANSTDYGSALSDSLLFYEAQRSGKLPDNQRVQWRGDSALTDGSVAGADLVGGYYDAGDNVKFGFPMAYTITMLAWGVVEYSSQFSANNQLEYALDAIRWGTDYFIKAHPQPNFLYAEVGDGDSDHACWERPEDMMTPRTVLQIDEQHPGSDLAGETAAALAAASIAFTDVDAGYSSELVSHAEQLFDFGVTYQGKYSDSIPAAQNYYPSSWYQDELAWAAAWLHRATQKQKYMDYLGNPPGGTGGPRTMFSWDDKYVGLQILAAKADYILGHNPKGISFMVGYGQYYPQMVHHRGASIVSIKQNPAPVGCGQGFAEWYNRNQPNPNVIVGAVVGGPDQNENYNDVRTNYQQNEPATATSAPLVGVLAGIA